MIVVDGNGETTVEDSVSDCGNCHRTIGGMEIKSWKFDTLFDYSITGWCERCQRLS